VKRKKGILDTAKKSIKLDVGKYHVLEGLNKMAEQPTGLLDLKRPEYILWQQNVNEFLDNISKIEQKIEIMTKHWQYC